MNNLYCGIIIIACLQTCMVSYSSSDDIIQVSATEGESVTLPVLYKGQGKYEIWWIRPGGNHFVTTTPDGEVDIRDDRYTGRLRGSTDGSLIISNVTPEDQGLYRASVLPSDGEPYGVMYNLSISGRNEHYTQDPCSVSCIIDGSDVTLTCGIASTHTITELYDPDFCTCVTPDANCSHCVLGESCRTGGNIDWISPVVLVLVIGILLVIVMVMVLYRKHHRHNKRYMGMGVAALCYFEEPTKEKRQGQNTSCKGDNSEKMKLSQQLSSQQPVESGKPDLAQV